MSSRPILIIGGGCDRNAPLTLAGAVAGALIWLAGVTYLAHGLVSWCAELESYSMNVEFNPEGPFQGLE